MLAEVFIAGGLLLVHLPAAPVVVAGGGRLGIVGVFAGVDLILDYIPIVVGFKDFFNQDVAFKVVGTLCFIDINLSREFKDSILAARDDVVIFL